MPGVSNVFKICDSYESGFGHGFKNSGLKNPFDTTHEPELFEAYAIGYKNGQFKYDAIYSKMKCKINKPDSDIVVAYEAGHLHGSKNYESKNSFDPAQETNMFVAYNAGYESCVKEYKRLNICNGCKELESIVINATVSLKSFIDEASSAMVDCYSCGNAVRLSDIISLSDVHEALKTLSKRT